VGFGIVRPRPGTRPSGPVATEYSGVENNRKGTEQGEQRREPWFRRNRACARPEREERERATTERQRIGQGTGNDYATNGPNAITSAKVDKAGRASPGEGKGQGKWEMIKDAPAHWRLPSADLLRMVGGQTN
jgi:hypothetical protein